MQFPKRRPTFDVWNHLESGLDHARAEFRDLPYEALGLHKDEEVVGGIEQEVLADFSDWIFSRLSMVATTPEDSVRAKDFLNLLKAENAEPWIEFATDIRFAEKGVRRASLALERYRALQPGWDTLSLSADASALLREAVHAYLFGFDAPCIAFCGIALERVLKDALVAVGAWTRDQAYGERRKAGLALTDATKEKLVRESYPQAEKLIKRRDKIVHSDPHAGSPSEELALESLSALGKVLEELGQSAARRIH